MSTKLNAEELAKSAIVIEEVSSEKRSHYEVRHMMFRHKEDAGNYAEDVSEFYAAAIREVAQPIADERDELKEFVGYIVSAGVSDADAEAIEERARAILAKYPTKQ